MIFLGRIIFYRTQLILKSFIFIYSFEIKASVSFLGYNLESKCSVPLFIYNFKTKISVSFFSYNTETEILSHFHQTQKYNNNYLTQLHTCFKRTIYIYSKTYSKMFVVLVTLPSCPIAELGSITKFSILY